MLINFAIPKVQIPKPPPDLGNFYWTLVGLRLFFTCLPQTGYIHPDEYFQSIEIVAGDMYRLETSRPWEFNITFPIRSIAVPYLTIGTGFKVLDVFDHFFTQYFDFSIRVPYFMIIFPRLIICLLSFLTDYSLYKICVITKVAYKERLLVLGSSYVLLVFGTHTFSNSIELILVALLLLYVTDSMDYSDAIISEYEYLSLLHSKAKSAVERARLHKARLFLPDHSLRYLLPISIITVVGTFNRPTFIAFAFSPLFFWLHRGLGHKSVSFRQFHYRMLMFLLCSVPTTLILIIIDSLYYGYISIPEIEHLDVSINSFVVTPLNFLKYNVRSDNLAKHGLHPRFLHTLVNIPLLFNVLGIIGILNFIELLYHFLRSRYKDLPSIRKVTGLMTASLLAPLVILSYFPHQEPRFIIPIALPLFYLHSNTLHPTAKVQNFLFKLWLAFNAVFLLFYGFVHQGGVYNVTSHLSKELRMKSRLLDVHIISSHIYSIPESLLLQRSTSLLYRYNQSKYKLPKEVFLYELGSMSLNSLLEQAITIQKLNTLKYSNSKRRFRILLILPGSLKDHLKYAAIHKNITFISLANFYPHISTEAFPNLFQYCLDIYPWGKCDQMHTYTPMNYFINLAQLFSLTLYEMLPLKT